MRPWQTYAWTVSAAGWATLAYLSGLPEAGLAALGCAVMAYVWYAIQQMEDDNAN